MLPETYQRIEARLQAQGYETARLQRTLQIPGPQKAER
jgi:hypothetical protein